MRPPWYCRRSGGRFFSSRGYRRGARVFALWRNRFSPSPRALGLSNSLCRRARIINRWRQRFVFATPRQRAIQRRAAGRTALAGPVRFCAEARVAFLTLREWNKRARGEKKRRAPAVVGWPPPNGAFFADKFERFCFPANRESHGNPTQQAKYFARRRGTRVSFSISDRRS